MPIKLPLHSIVVFVGPKNYLANDVVFFQLYNQRAGIIVDGSPVYPWHSVQCFSLYDCQREALGDPNAPDESQAMAYAKHAGENLLYHKIKNTIQYPCLADAVLVDDVDNPDLIGDIEELAKNLGYHYNFTLIGLEYDLQSKEKIDTLKAKGYKFDRIFKSPDKVPSVWMFDNVYKFNRLYLHPHATLHVFGNELRTEFLEELKAKGIYQERDKIVVFSEDKRKDENTECLWFNEETPFLFNEDVTVTKAYCDIRSLRKLDHDSIRNQLVFSTKIDEFQNNGIMPLHIYQDGYRPTNDYPTILDNQVMIPFRNCAISFKEGRIIHITYFGE